MWTVDTLKGDFQLPEAAARERRNLEIASLYQLHNLEIEVEIFAGERVIGVHLDPPVVADALDNSKQPFDSEAVADLDLLLKRKEKNECRFGKRALLIPRWLPTLISCEIKGIKENKEI